MSPLLRIPLGIVIVVVGFHMVFKTGAYLDFVGRNDWAEQKFGPGGTTTFLKLLGVGICFVGVFVATNLISDILGGVAQIFVHKPG